MSLKNFEVNDNNATYFYSFGVEHIQKEMKKITGNKNIIRNIYRIEARHLIMCEYFGIVGFIDFMLKSQSFLDYRNLFSPSKYEKMIK